MMNGVHIPRKAAILGYAGVIPFIAPIILMLVAEPAIKQHAIDAFLVYGAVILSFLGGIRWGAASTDNTDTGRAFLVSVAPSLWAAACLLWPSDLVSVLGLMAGFVLMGLADWFYPGLRVGSWMRHLRKRLTLAVFASHLMVIGLM
jgi:hypothetical protein